MSDPLSTGGGGWPPALTAGRRCVLTVPADPDNRFAATRRVESWCRDHNLALGPMQRDEPRGIMWPRDEWDVAKWRNLTGAEMVALDGVVLTTPDGAKSVWLRPATIAPAAIEEAP